MKTISRWIQLSFSALFLFIFYFILKKFIVRGFWYVIPAGIAAIIAVFILYHFLNKKVNFTDFRKADKIFAVIAVIIFMIQIFSVIMLECSPVRDLLKIDTAARHFMLSWDINDLKSADPKVYEYIMRYPNNHAILIIISLLYSASTAIFGRVPLIVPQLFNMIHLFISVILLYLISKKIFKNPVDSLFCGLLCLLFHVFYIYIPIYYTDTISMPFLLMSVLFFLYAEESDNKKRTVIFYILCTASIVLGFSIKGSIIIMLPACLLCIAYKFKKAQWFKTVKKIIAFSLCFIICLFSYNMLTGLFKIESKELKEQWQYPYTHWVMMGLKGNGGFSKEDFDLTYNSGNYEQKKAVNKAEIEKRVKAYGMVGLSKHLIKKAVRTWGDGTYFIRNNFINNGKSNWYRTFITQSKGFYIYANGLQIMLLLMIIISFASGWLKRNDSSIDSILIIRIAVCGIFLFLLLWETRSRYIINFSPFLLILCIDAVKVVYNRFIKNTITLNKP